MKNRLTQKLDKARNNKTKLFSAFLTLGYPNLKTTESMILSFERQGVDILELGFPFSDPLADGPTIQFSSEKALKGGVCIQDAFDLVARLRKKGCEIPTVFFTYFNPILRYGTRRFVQSAAKAGFDGVLIPDLPPEEEKELNRECRKQKLCQIYLVAPTTSRQRAAYIASQSTGFIYYVSLRGVTGARKAVPSDIARHLGEVKKMTSKPVLVGFGVSTPEQAGKLSRLGDGVIVGSALIEKIRQGKGKPEKAFRLVSDMIKAVKGKNASRS